jgi:tetratricopeptide (TPR) repeat protein
MDLRTRIQSLFKEAEIYRQQGLLEESKAKYQDVMGLLEKNPNIKNRDQLLGALQKKVQAVSREVQELDEKLSPEQVPGNVQDLVKGFFAEPAKDKDQGAAAFKGAIALAQLRQFDRALAEFSRLLENEAMRVPAAKNVLKCHLAIKSVDAAVEQYEKWLEDELFANDELESVRVFFEELMTKKGMQVSLKRRQEPAFEPESAPQEEVTSLKMAPSAVEMAAEAAAEEAVEEDQIEICSLEITPLAGPKKGIPIELDVSAQAGNKLHITVPAKDADYLEGIESGQHLDDLQFFSHFVMFRGGGVVLAKRKIEAGARKGDYNISIRMEAPGTQG